LKVKPRGQSTAVSVADHVSGWVNVKSYGAKGDGVTDDYAALSAMVTALGSTNATLIVPGPCVVGTDLTIPENLPVRFLGAGAFTGSGTVTYTGEPANAATLAATAVAESAKTAAETARDAANATGKVYPDTASGIAATVEGAYFSVPSAGSSESLILYRKTGGVAVEAKRYPTADATLKPSWAGRKNGWPDPFFRRFDLTTEAFFGRDRWSRRTGTSSFSGWTRVPNSVFDGYALRRPADLSSGHFQGPVIHLDELGAVAGDTVTVCFLIAASASGTAMRVTGTCDAGTDGGSVGAQFNAQIPGSTSDHVLGTAPTVIAAEVVVPVGATRIQFWPWTSTAGRTLDVLALWAFKGAFAAGPQWPTQCPDEIAVGSLLADVSDLGVRVEDIEASPAGERRLSSRCSQRRRTRSARSAGSRSTTPLRLSSLAPTSIARRRRVRSRRSRRQPRPHSSV
jgi:hypothetical protein